MNLQDIYERHVFDDATTDRDRTRVYVRPGELGLDQRADVELMNALTAGDSPHRVHIVGASGAGKTSLILRVVGDLARRRCAVQHEVLVLRVGDRPESLSSPDEVIKMVLDTVGVEGHRFANIDPQILQDALADQRIRNPAQVEHRAALTAPIVSYTASIKEAYTTLGFGQSAPRLRHDLEDVLARIAAAGYRPVLVLDDTEKFVSPGSSGDIEAASVENLYHHGVRILGELGVDLVVAMHPQFAKVKRVAEVVERLAMRRIDVPELPACHQRPALGRILERRMKLAGIAGSIDDVVTRAAVDELQLLYHERDRNLRSVLKVAQRATGNALHRGAAAVEGVDIRTAVAYSKPSRSLS